jgi:predicted Rossmann fold nucleotide-binding protein DprA/Smf involved in DNA uptake
MILKNIFIPSLCANAARLVISIFISLSDFRKCQKPGKNQKEYKKLDGFGLKRFRYWKSCSFEICRKELKFCEKNNIKINLRHLHDLPKLLNECDDAPAILYQKGNIDDVNQK